jgi:DNA modification methylase
MSMLLTQADARHLPFADGCVQCCVTSPPYWGLRNYGIAGQLGLESTPDAYVQNMVQVFREVWRVLRDDGVCWLNLGDSYAGSWGNQGRKEERGTQRPINGGMLTPVLDGRYPSKGSNTGAVPAGLKPKDLVGIPWRVAFALQADGWYLRSDVIWSKPNPMPESVTDRPTKAHEYVFLLTKSERYYWDADAVRERQIGDGRKRGCVISAERGLQVRSVGGVTYGGRRTEYQDTGTRNLRSVWHIATQPHPGAHFATMPEKLVERCVLAGSKAGDVVLDPFMGSGTVARVALKLGRRAIGCDLNPAYLKLADARTRVTYGLPLGEDVA